MFPYITSSMFGKSTGTSVTNGDKIVNTAKKAHQLLLILQHQKQR